MQFYERVIYIVAIRYIAHYIVFLSIESHMQNTHIMSK